MESFKKSESNIVNFIKESLKNSEIKYVNGELPVMHEMRNLSSSPSSPSSPLSPSLTFSKLPSLTLPRPFSIILKLIGVFLVIFLIFKIVNSPIKDKLKTLLGTVEKDIKRIEIIHNPMFNTSNNLNSNQILDFLLGTEKKTDNWCFFGEANKSRYCTLMQGEQCMSGNIFPTRDLCVNPKLKL